jgi:hypothetical protein
MLHVLLLAELIPASARAFGEEQGRWPLFDGASFTTGTRDQGLEEIFLFPSPVTH